MADEKGWQVKGQIPTMRTPDSKVQESNINNTTVAEISMSENVFVESTKQHLNHVRIAQIEFSKNNSSLPHVNHSDNKLCIDETDSLECTVPLDLSKLSEGDTSNCEASVETISPILAIASTKHSFL